MPDFERVRKTLLLQGEPDRVPIMEHNIDRDVKKAFLGRDPENLEDEVEFWMAAGYDYVPLAVGLRTAIRVSTGLVQADAGVTDLSRALKIAKTKYSVIEDEERERGWAEGGTGIIAGRAEFEAIKWPDPEAMDYSVFEEIQRYLPKGAKVIASIGYIFSTAVRLMGFQNFCEKLIDEPDLVERVIDTIGNIQLKVFERVAGMDVVGATWHPDDVAYGTGLMIAPHYLRKFHWPWYREMGRISRSLGKPLLYHSDGKLDEVLDDIVECGITTLHPIESKLMDIVQVKRQYGHWLSLIGNLDLNYLLPMGTPEEVDAEVRRLVREVAPGGGYAVGSGNSVTEYVPVANFNAMREAAFKYGKYPISL